MPLMTCLPCDLRLLITPQDPPQCPTCLGSLAPTTLAAVLARRQGDVALGAYPEAYRAFRLREQARAAITESMANRARLQELRAENARLRSELASTVASVRVAVEG